MRSELGQRTVCAVCRHADVQGINTSLLHGTPLTEIATRYGWSRPTVTRHAHQHIPAMLRRIQEGEDLLSARTLLAILLRVKENIEAVMTEARRTHNPILRLAAARELKGFAEFLARLTRRLGPEVAVTINVEQTLTDEEATRAARTWLERHALEAGNEQK